MHTDIAAVLGVLIGVIGAAIGMVRATLGVLHGLSAVFSALRDHYLDSREPSSTAWMAEWLNGRGSQTTTL